MLNRYRNIFNKLCRHRSYVRPPPIANYRAFVKIPTASLTLGFSLFTWLGFENKHSAQDDLIQTIKHCIIFIHNQEYVKAEQLLHVALRQAQQMNNQRGITYIYDIMANLALEREELDKAKQLFISVTQRILADGAKEDDPRVVHLSAKLARISHLKKDYPTAQLGYDWCLEKLKSAVEIDSDSVTKKLLAMTEDWYGRLFLDCNQNEQALLLMVSALDWMRQVPDVEPEHIVMQLNDIGTVYDKLGKSDESIIYFKDAITMGKDLNMHDFGAMYVNLGKAYIKKNLIDEARKSCGLGWKLGVVAKNNEIKQEAESCLKEIKNHA